MAWIVCFPIGFLINLSRFAQLIETSMEAVWFQIKGSFFSTVIMYISVTLMRLLLKEYASSVVTMLASIVVGIIVYVITVFTIDRKSCQIIIELLIQIGNLQGNNYLKRLNLYLSKSM